MQCETGWSRNVKNLKIKKCCQSRYGIFSMKGRQQDPVVLLCKEKQSGEGTEHNRGEGQKEEGRTDDHIKAEERQTFSNVKTSTETEKKNM